MLRRAGTTGWVYVHCTPCPKEAAGLTVSIQVPFNESARAQFAGYTQYGTKWLKALYRGYTDSHFTERVGQPAFQGSQGPTIRAEVGDMIEILFINNLKKNFATIHSMGLAYSKTYEGSNYPNNTIPGAGVDLLLTDRVPPAVGPGDCVVYKWVINDPAGPARGIPAKVRT
jgi:FtsP/CotA-like multicopper oxidase with cupredoxin domain